MLRQAVIFFILGSSCALRLQSLREEDSTTLVDLVIDQLRQASPNGYSFPSLDFGVSALNEEQFLDNSSYFGTLYSNNGWVGDFKTLQRASPVSSSVVDGNLTLETSLTFGTLRASWSSAELRIIGVPMVGDVSVGFRQNEFVVKLTVYNDPLTMKCAVDLKKAAFSVLSAIDISIRPVGFFNQIHLDATINHISQSVFEKYRYVDLESLQKSLKTIICRALPS